MKMSSKLAIEINQAILDCTKSCVDADDPATCTREYCAELLNTGTWELGDIEAVVEGALGVLAQLTGDCDLTPGNRPADQNSAIR